MAKAKRGNIIGGWAFLAGLIIAIIVGLGFAGGLTTNWLYTLVVIGLIVGLLNIADEEVNPFLMSGAVLIIASSLGQSVTSSVPILNSVLQSLLAIFVPATVIVAIKNVLRLASR